MKPHLISLALSSFCVSPWATQAAQSETRKPNVLFIAVDDLRPELGCYGQQAIQSPNIDQLASSGVLFERAYCQLAVCNPSRVSLLTGLRPDSTKVWDLATRFRDTIPNAVTLPQHFKRHGYHAASYGKIFHNPWPDDQSWSEPHSWPAKRSLWSAEAKQQHAEYRREMRNEGRPEKKIARMRAQATEIVDKPETEHIDGAIAEQALASMRRLAKKEQPFFLAAGFVRPHLPFVVPRKYWELYERDSIPLASNPFLPRDAPPFAMNTMYELRDYFDFDRTPGPDEGSLTTQQQRRLKHGYYAAVSFVDSLIGKLTAELETLGIDDNTIVVLWGDHGWKLGEHNSWCKQTNYEIDTRVPLIIRDPRAGSNGQSTNALVELVDIYPTLCELTDLPIDKKLEGKSLAPLLRDASQRWSEVAMSQFQRKLGTERLMGYAMRTDNYRYVEWQNRSTGKTVAIELYDHRRDREENSNIATDPAHADLVEQLSQKLWDTLPRPSVNKTVLSTRSLVRFRNQTNIPVTLFWIMPNGDEKRLAVIAPGKELTQNTTIGHVFNARAEDEFERSYRVNKETETFKITKENRPAKPNLNPTQRQVQANTDQANPDQKQPNIVFCIADDWSWPHASALGDPVVATPAFDRIANEGILFENAFVSTPSCTPSRLSILTGQHHWRLREGDSLGGSLREEYPVYTELLAAAGYHVGRFGKGVWPSKHTFRNRDSFGERYRSFNEFVEKRSKNQPFCFWHGGQDPHRPYELGVGSRSGIDLSKVEIPRCLPDNETVRGDVADYLWEVQRFDREVSSIISQLEEMGELENTIFIVSSDNGMPFPRCKATLYDLGTRVPLAIRWGERVRGERRVDDFVSLCDIAPTLLEATGLDRPNEMTGRSLLPILLSKNSGQVDPARRFVLTGTEQHVYPYPKRAIRNGDFLYIRNYNPEEWKTGETPGVNPEHDFASTPWPTSPGSFSYAIDPSPTKQFLRLNRLDPTIKRYADMAFPNWTDEELYDLTSDPDQLHNVADAPEYEATKMTLRRRLIAEQIKSNDPRVAVAGYDSDSVEGWPVRVSKQLKLKNPTKTRQAMELLADQIRTVRQVLPAKALAILQDVPIWLSAPYENVRPTGEYHPNRGWLIKHGRDPKLHRCVEFTNIDNFEAEIRRMPVMVLHELAHAYHDQILGFDNALIKAAYDRASQSGTYESILRSNGNLERAYAMSTPMEYFAETSEAYFGVNDFYPFRKSELKRHDPAMTKLLERLWDVNVTQGGEQE